MSWWAIVVAVGLGAIGRRDTVKVWSLDEYLELARAASPALVAAKERQLAAQARVAPATRPEDPMIEIGSMNRSIPSLGRRSPIAMDQIRLVQAVPLSGRLGAAAGALRSRARAEADQAREVDRQLRWQIVEGFTTLARLDRTAALLRRYAPLVEQLQEVSRARYASGLVAQADVIRAQLETARFGEEAIAVRAERAAMVARLNALALRAEDATITAVVLPDVPDSLPPARDLAALAIQTRPALDARRAEFLALGEDRRRADAERWPDLEFGLGYGQQPMAGGAGTERMLSVTIGGRLPIWSAKRRGVRDETRAMEREAAAEITMAEADTRARIGELAADLERIRRLLTLYRGTLLPQSNAAALSTLASYRNGTGDFEAVGTATLAAFRIELDLVRLESERTKVFAELDYLTGIGSGSRADGGRP